jgi:ubiquinone/menaquinone biosynthesis C-methylase UbiE
LDWKETAAYWDANADAWSKMAREGADVCRNYLNAPEFLSNLPDVMALEGLDVGCGEGYNTRLVARRGARLWAIDASAKFIEYALAAERDEPLGIDYSVASATDLPFDGNRFDFVIATMSLMDIPELQDVISEIHRVLKPGGFLQFSICHPCFQTPLFEWVEKEGRRTALICGDYFERVQGKIETWTFSQASAEMQSQYPPFRVPTFFYTLSDWMNMLIGAGFQLEHFAEPCPDQEMIESFPTLAGLAKVALFLHVRCRKI